MIGSARWWWNKDLRVFIVVCCKYGTRSKIGTMKTLIITVLSFNQCNIYSSTKTSPIYFTFVLVVFVNCLFTRNRSVLFRIDVFSRDSLNQQHIFPRVQRLKENLKLEQKKACVCDVYDGRSSCLLVQPCFCRLNSVYIDVTDWPDHQPSFLIDWELYYRSSEWSWCEPRIAYFDYLAYLLRNHRKKQLAGVGSQACGRLC